MALKLQVHSTCSKNALSTLVLFLSISGTFCVPPETQRCNSQDCKGIMKSIAGSIDQVVHPCDDFYEHACGLWSKTHPAPYETSIWNNLHMTGDKVLHQMKDLLDAIKNTEADALVRKAKKAYDVCMDIAEIEMSGIDYLLALTNDVGGWPMITPQSERAKTTYFWEKVHTTYGVITGEGGLMNIIVQDDKFNNEKPTLYLDQPTGLFKGLNMIKTEEDERKYEFFVKTIAEAFGNERNRGTLDEKTLDKDIKDLLKFRKRLREIMAWGEDRRNTKRMYNPITIRDLQNWNAELNKKSKSVTLIWKSFIKTTIEGARHIDITDEQEIIFQEKDYIEKLFILLAETDDEIIVNHIHLFIVETHLMYTDKRRRLAVSIVREESDNLNDKHRWRMCISTHPMKHVLSRIYVKKYFTDTMKEDLKELISDVQKAAIEEIKRSPWLSKGVRENAVKKLENMGVIYGYPDWYQNSELMVDYYKGQEVSDVYLHNVLSYERMAYKRQVETLSPLNFRNTMLSYPIDPEIGYIMSQNVVEIPAATMQSPLFSSDVPNVIRYATIGHVLGHEVAHSLDPKGRTYDEHGIKKDWWDKQTLEKYNERMKCISDKYSDFAIKELRGIDPNLRSNGVATVNEDFSDILGLQIAFQSYKKSRLGKKEDLFDVPGFRGLNENELFFYANAQVYCEDIDNGAIMNYIENDEHSMNHLRVIGPFSNMPEFGATFGCSATSFMNSRPKCPIWSN